MFGNKKKSIIKTVSPERKQIFRIGGIVLLIILISAAFIFILYRNSIKRAEEELANMDPYDRYVGPADAADRGEWVEPVEYYSFYDGTGLEGDVVGTMFQKEGGRKGIVPAGVRLHPVVVTYDDFSPYSDKSEYGFLDDYGCQSEPDELEAQLGVTADMSITGSYRNMKNNMFYDGQINIDLKNVNYYMEMLYDPEAEGEEMSAPGYYGYLNPNMEFDYKLSGNAHITDNYPDYLGEIMIEGEGKLDPTKWSFTSSMSGQEDDVFRMGTVYIRCKLPCKVKKEFEGKKETYESYVNIYFKINEVRIGTRMDCMPDTSEAESEETVEE